MGIQKMCGIMIESRLRREESLQVGGFTNSAGMYGTIGDGNDLSFSIFNRTFKFVGKCRLYREIVIFLEELLL